MKIIAIIIISCILGLTASSQSNRFYAKSAFLKEYIQISTGPKITKIQMGFDTARSDVQLMTSQAIGNLVDGRQFSTIVYGQDVRVVKKEVSLAPTDSAYFENTIITVSSNYTANLKNHTILVDASTGSKVISLPAVAISKNVEYTIIKKDASANNIIIDPSGLELINGALTKTFTVQYSGCTFQCDGVTWIIKP